MCSGVVNLHNLNFLWFNVEQVRIVLKEKFISSFPCVMLYMEVFQRYLEDNASSVLI